MNTSEATVRSMRPSKYADLDESDQPVPRVFSFVDPERVEKMRAIVAERRMEEGRRVAQRYGMPMDFALNVVDERWTLLTALRKARRLEGERRPA
ncbi:MAG: hypothetical protein HY719_01935 [Planctomycetes bacterium]|nr:hypothetical protein [Planctomycetota bacterium]